MKPHLLTAALAAAVSVALPVWAEKADRGKQIVIQAEQQGTGDLLNQVVVLSGNVELSQGTLSIRAERMEVRTRSDGHRTATALGLTGKPARFRQKRDGVDEYVEGSAELIEFDSRGDVVRFVGSAQVRRLRGSTTADEVTGNVITYDNGNETFSVQGAPAAASAPGATPGRVRVVITPPPEPAASAPK